MQGKKSITIEITVQTFYLYEYNNKIVKFFFPLLLYLASANPQ